MKESIIIVGSKGQDGSLLRDHLSASQLNVISISRKEISESACSASVKNLCFDIGEASSVNDLIKKVQPREVYFLAAHHVSAQEAADDSSLDVYNQYHQVHVAGLVNFLNAIRRHAPACRLFYAASSLIYDGITSVYQDEDTPLTPVGFYGLSKAQGVMLCREFRKSYGVFASVGILYNHESILRSEKFLSMKLIMAAKRISVGLKTELIVGDLSAEVDWGYAPDFIKAFRLILSIKEPGDFIVATGESHTVAEFADIVFERFGLNYKEYIRENPELLHRRVPKRIGRNEKLRIHTGWAPSLSFRSFVLQLVDDYVNMRHSHSNPNP